ncbi:phosphoribosylglycinamide formyltransferase [Tichowtungia aerotolerans]|uniref:Phosphoribosylglycinamide formyltransferase n=1 Tax=Tichowtungia aerotolerans TaxID=2697043 RepID=A0A6P1MG85_9BACT|nr:phosphoribosylglycinamide formyltransferase [Tichowtungia aerotolerans]QHI70095.1 phosphoribosylglycinamide formyltransferase [Tichowtungia aerotolerans]
MLNIAVFGSGSGSNYQAIAEAIEKGQLNAQIACVFADNQDAFILERARKFGHPAIYLDCAPFKSKLDGEAEQRAIGMIKEHGGDFIALAGFMRIVKPGLLRAFAGRIVNIHPSLLPNFPGLHAGKQALEAGATETGCTVHFVDEGIDTGPVIIQKRVEILPNDTEETLMNRIHEQEHIAYPEALRRIANGDL